MYWDYILSIAGVAGFILAGKKIWWAWYINIAAQFIWLAYALVTEQYGFLIGTFIYFGVFAKNAYDWTKEHNLQVSAERAVAVSKLKTLQETLDIIRESVVTPEQLRKTHEIR